MRTGLCISGQRLVEVFGHPGAAQQEPSCLQPLQGPSQAQCKFEGQFVVSTSHTTPVSKVMLNPGPTVRWASQISCCSLFREVLPNGILETVENSKCGLHSVFLCLGFLEEESHVPSKCYLVVGIFLSHSQHESDTKFILILDRRLDTWTSVKMTLQKIAVSPV